MTPDDPRHGTTRGHAAGCREPCCRRARNLDERRRRKYREALGINRSVPAQGTQRRIRALMALGWTSRDIADRCGWQTPQAVTELLTMRKTVYAATSERIATVYDDLSMRPGPSAKNRREARAKRWPPPLAWDCIDTDPEPQWGGTDTDIDPVVVMRLLEGRRIKEATKAEKEEAMRRWVADGGSERELCAVHGWNAGRYTAGLRLVRGGAA